MTQPIYERVDRVHEEITQAEIDETTREMEEWDASPEGQAFAAEWSETKKRLDADPTRLTNQGLEPHDLMLRFAQGVQALWDETGKPCSMAEAGERAGFQHDECVVPCVLALLRGLTRHPLHPDDTMLEATNLYEPGVG